MTIPSRWRDASALQQVVANNVNPVLQGFVMPRYDVEPDNADGLFFYNTTSSKPAYNDGSTWNYFVAEDGSGNVSVSGNLAVGGTLGVTGAVTLSSTLGVTGATTLSTLAAGNTAITGTLSVSGTSSLAGVTASTVSASGNMTTTGNGGFGTSSPSAKLDVNSDIMRLRTAKTPASATASGVVGSICWDSDFIYVCIASNTWKRATLATW